MKHLLLALILLSAFITEAQNKKKPKKAATKTSTKAKVVTTTNNTPAPAPAPANNQTTTTTTTNNRKSGTKQNNSGFGNLGLGNGEHLKKGSKVIEFGIGFSNYSVPLHVAFEKFVKDDIGVGLFGNIQSYNSYGFAYNDSYVITHGGLKANYYFNHIIGANDNVWHFGAGLSLGYWRYFYTGDPALSIGNTGNIYLASQIEVRYFFNKHWGILLEGNYGSMNGGVLGLSYR